VNSTIEIPDSLFRRLKSLAAERRTTLKALVQAAIRQMVGSGSRRQRGFRLRQASVRGKGVQPGIREGRWADFRSLIYEGQGG